MQHELESDGVPVERRTFKFLGDLRYIGQFHEIVCDIPDYLDAAYDAAALAEVFHQQHAAHYGHADRHAPVEIVNLRIEATGKLDTPEPGMAAVAHEAAPASPLLQRKAVMGQGAPAIDVPVYDRAALVLSQVIDGPAILVQRDSTTVVFAGQQAEACSYGSLRIRETA